MTARDERRDGLARYVRHQVSLPQLSSGDSMMAGIDWVTVYTLADPIKAEIIKNKLEEEGMRVSLEGIQQAAEPGLLALEIKVQVLPPDAARARAIIEQHEHVPVSE
jgi:hypothetical protein